MTDSNRDRYTAEMISTQLSPFSGGGTGVHLVIYVHANDETPGYTRVQFTFSNRIPGMVNELVHQLCDTLYVRLWEDVANCPLHVRCEPGSGGRKILSLARRQPKPVNQPDVEPDKWFDVAAFKEQCRAADFTVGRG